jgi:hypothetical protein
MNDTSRGTQVAALRSGRVANVVHSPIRDAHFLNTTPSAVMAAKRQRRSLGRDQPNGTERAAHWWMSESVNQLMGGSVAPARAARLDPTLCPSRQVCARIRCAIPLIGASIATRMCAQARRVVDSLAYE